MNPLAAAAAASMILAGIMLGIAGLRPVPVDPARPSFGRRLRRALGQARPRRTWQTQAAVGALVGMGVWWATGWAIAVVLVPLAVLGVPLFLQSSPHEAVLDRLDAMAEWTRNLADVITVGVGIEQAILNSRRGAPNAIKDEVGLLCDRIQSRFSTRDALRAFADDVDDKTGDLVAAALINGSAHPSDRLGHVLQGLAEATAEEARARREIEAERAKPRGNSRSVTLVLTLVITGMFFTPYFDPYRTPEGQALLLGLLALYAGCLMWIRRATTTPPEPRFLGAKARERVEGMIR